MKLEKLQYKNFVLFNTLSAAEFKIVDKTLKTT